MIDLQPSAEEAKAYGGTEIEEILRVAGEARRRLDYLSLSDLVRAAGEMGIPESAVVQAEQLVRERQTELDDREEYRRLQKREFAKGAGIAVPVLTFIIFAHAVHIFGNFFSFGKLFLKPLGGLLFSRSTQHEMDFQSWRNKRYRKALNLPEPPPDVPTDHLASTDVGVLFRLYFTRPVGRRAFRERLEGYWNEKRASKAAEMKEP